MARPMKLMREKLLAKLYAQHVEGMKHRTLIANNMLPVTGPTLAKLLKYYGLTVNGGPELSRVVRDSLFPKWVSEMDTDICSQPNDWVYRGNMPLGRWESR